MNHGVVDLNYCVKLVLGILAGRVSPLRLDLRDSVATVNHEKQ
jgi:hypothetical protein